MFPEAGMTGEVVLLAVFEDEDTARRKQSRLQDELWDIGEVRQGVGRVGEDEVESPLVPIGLFKCGRAGFNVQLLLCSVQVLSGFLQVAEYVTADELVVGDAEFAHAFADEAGVVAVGLYADHLFAASRQQFERDAACASKEVEGTCAFKVDVCVEDIKDVLFRKVGGGACLEGVGYVEAATFVDACDDAHLLVDS